ACWDALKGARFVYDPSPRNVAPLARLFEQSIHALHFVRRHRRDQATSEQLVADTASSNRLCGLGLGVHRLDQIEGSLRHAATLFGTGFKMLRSHAPPSAISSAFAACLAVGNRPRLDSLASNDSNPARPRANTQPQYRPSPDP